MILRLSSLGTQAQRLFSKKTPSPTKIVLDPSELKESFLKGGGAGGQKVNKCVSAVQLTHLPSGITVFTQRFRGLAANRKEARKLLVDKLDVLINASNSKREIKYAKLRKAKAKAKARQQKLLSESNESSNNDSNDSLELSDSDSNDSDSNDSDSNDTNSLISDCDRHSHQTEFKGEFRKEEKEKD